MPDFKQMYTKLFQTQSQVIEILQQAQRDTEEMYIEAEPPSLTVFSQKDPKNNDDGK